jgi:hypothetical protein
MAIQIFQNPIPSNLRYLKDTVGYCACSPIRPRNRNSLYPLRFSESKTLPKNQEPAPGVLGAGSWF